MRNLDQPLSNLIGFKLPSRIKISSNHHVPSLAKDLMESGYNNYESLIGVIDQLVLNITNLNQSLGEQRELLKQWQKYKIPEPPEQALSKINGLIKKNSSQWLDIDQGASELTSLLQDYRFPSGKLVKPEAFATIENNQLQLYIKVINQVATDYGLESEPLTNVIIMYFICYLILKIGLDADNCSWTYFNESEDKLKTNLTAYMVKQYLKQSNSKHLDITFAKWSTLVYQQQDWTVLEQYDIESLRSAIIIIRKKPSPATWEDFLFILNELSNL